MSNFAMYGLANRGQLVAQPADTGPSSQVAIMQELSGLCLKIYRSVNLRFQRIAQMMLSGNISPMQEILTTNFCYKMVSHQSLVLTRISPDCMMVDEPGRRVGIIDDSALVKQHELPAPENCSLRSTLLVRGGHLFVGYSNGMLQKLDAETLELQYEVRLHQHIFCLEHFDDDHIVAGQMNGWVDLVSIDDGRIILSKELKHVTGNITLIKRTAREQELLIGTQRGVYVALVGRGIGLKEVEMRAHNVMLAKSAQGRLILDEQASSRIPALTERAEIASHGPRHTDVDGMS